MRGKTKLKVLNWVDYMAVAEVTLESYEERRTTTVIIDARSRKVIANDNKEDIDDRELDSAILVVSEAYLRGVKL